MGKALKVGTKVDQKMSSLDWKMAALIAPLLVGTKVDQKMISLDWKM